MDLINTPDARTEKFIQRWEISTASERATSQSFIIELCELLDVPRPHATAERDYMFERALKEAHADGQESDRYVDCYKRGHFILEAKKVNTGSHTKSYSKTLFGAHAQAQNYARALPAAEGRPPIIMVVDVGQVIQLFAEFSRTGGNYIPYPDPRNHQIKLQDLRDEKIRQRLRLIWTDPMALDPSRANAKVTREVASVLATVAKSLEADGHPPHQVGAFLTRCLFSMFAEDVGLLPASDKGEGKSEGKGAFTELLQTHRQQPPTLQRMLQALWADMDRGGFSAALAREVRKFNGKLFKASQSEGYALLLSTSQIDGLLTAAKANWTEVEPAIFGTLLERALDPDERHALGAHFTPRAYVDRLVIPTVIEPLRAEWSDTQAATMVLMGEHDALNAEADQLTDALGQKQKAQREANNKVREELKEIDNLRADARAKKREAIQTVKAFHHRLCTVRVLDPACGSGNFLYVTLEHLKRLEGEVLNLLESLDAGQNSLNLEGETVSLQQLQGIEINSRAAALAELVLWIGYLQWQARTVGVGNIAEPVVHDYGNIQNRDAVLAYDSTEPLKDEAGRIVTRWDGKTFKPHPVTGLDVPDESAQVVQMRYINPRKAQWPQVHFIVGNPPFIGASTMRAALGDGYVDALRSSWPEVPESADLVMYWWHQAALTVRAEQAQRFGFITTNSIKQTFNRRVMQAALDGTMVVTDKAAVADKAGERQAGGLMLPNAQKSPPGLALPSLKPLSLVFAVADHPWVDGANGAAVRIAMTAAQAGEHTGRLLTVQSETPQDDGEVAVTLSETQGLLHADLRIGANVAAAKALKSTFVISNRGFELGGAGFIVTRSEASQLGLGAVAGVEKHIREYRNGRDLTGTPRDAMVIDLFGLSADQVREKFPSIYQWVLERVKPERDVNRNELLRTRWWLHRRLREDLRMALDGLPRYIVTVETSKHRLFQFLDATVLPDNKLIAIALDDAFNMGVLSSEIHSTWSFAAGSTLEDRPVYVKTTCFETFPFPAEDTGLTPALTERIRLLAEQLDAHRKTQQAAHPDLTLTGIYNVLEKLRSGEALSAKDKTMHEQGLVSVLRTLHDELDAAVLQAYGWSDLGPVPHQNDAARAAWTDALLLRLVDLNTRRAAEEATGTIRWLRPDYQNPASPKAPPVAQQASLDMDHDMATESGTKPGTKKNPGIDTNANDGEDNENASHAATAKPASQQAWPTTVPEQIKAVAAVLNATAAPLDMDAIAAHFKAKGRWRDRLPVILDTLVAIGRVRQQGETYASC